MLISGGELNFVLAERIGKVVRGQKVAGELIEKVLASSTISAR